MLNADMIYEAADYLRLSKEDGDFSLSNDKLESDSISSQRAIIERFVAQNPNIKLVAEFCDDGYTGTNFDRPDFQRMMEAVKAGKINCVIVKDLSRFGRDYIDAGKYIEKIFSSARCTLYRSQRQLRQLKSFHRGQPCSARKKFPE